MLKVGLNKIIQHSETIFKFAFPLFIVACVLTFLTFRSEFKEGRVVEQSHHEEVKGLVKQSIEKQQVTEVKVDKLDKKVDRVAYDVHIGQTKYLKDLSQINKTLKNNAASYDKTYALMDTTDIAAINSFNAKWFSKADSIEW